MNYIHGQYYTAKIDGIYVEGVVTIEDRIYLCQNKKDGSECDEKWGYPYSWTIENGTSKDLDRSSIRVSELVLHPIIL